MKKLASLLFAMCLSVQAFSQLPSVVLKDINGKSVDVAKLENDGKPIIIDFFATWCKPCNRALSAIHEVYEEWQEETGVKLVAVSIDVAQNVNKVKPMVNNYGWTYDVLLDTDQKLKRAFGVQMIPYTVIVDGEGNIAYKHSGYTDGAEEELIEVVRELVAKDAKKKK